MLYSYSYSYSRQPVLIQILSFFLLLYITIQILVEIFIHNLIRIAYHLVIVIVFIIDYDAPPLRQMVIVPIIHCPNINCQLFVD